MCYVHWSRGGWLAPLLPSAQLRPLQLSYGGSPPGWLAGQRALTPPSRRRAQQQPSSPCPWGPFIHPLVRRRLVVEGSSRATSPQLSKKRRGPHPLAHFQVAPPPSAWRLARARPPLPSPPLGHSDGIPLLRPEDPYQRLGPVQGSTSTPPQKPQDSAQLSSQSQRATTATTTNPTHQSDEPPVLVPPSCRLSLSLSPRARERRRPFQIAACTSQRASCNVRRTGSSERHAGGGHHVPPPAALPCPGLQLPSGQVKGHMRRKRLYST